MPMINSTEIKRQLPDEELLTFGYKPAKTAAAGGYTPGDPITKEMIADYYHKMAGYIMPYIESRPQYVSRDLTFDEAIFLKEGDPSVPVLLNHIKSKAPREKGLATVLCNSMFAFLYLVNKGQTEINLWHSTPEAIDYPNYLVIDLDPSEHNSFSQVKRVARIVKSVLDKAGAESFCKTSGASGIHIFIPIGMRYPYSVIKDFAFTICMLANKRMPELTSMDKKKAHKQHKIHLDYTQNIKGKSLVSVYSVRDLPGAPVSTPVAWEELTDDLNPYDFNISTVPERLKKSGDLFSGLLSSETNLLQCMQNLGSQ